MEGVDKGLAERTLNLVKILNVSLRYRGYLCTFPLRVRHSMSLMVGKKERNFFPEKFLSFLFAPESNFENCIQGPKIYICAARGPRTGFSSGC